MMRDDVASGTGAHHHQLCPTRLLHGDERGGEAFGMPEIVERSGGDHDREVGQADPRLSGCGAVGADAVLPVDQRAGATSGAHRSVRFCETFVAAAGGRDVTVCMASSLATTAV